MKQTIKIIYWFSCYSIIFITVIISAVRSLILKKEDKKEISHFLMIFSFFLLMFGSTIYSILSINNRQIEIVFNLVAMAGVCLGIYSIPLFAFNISEDKVTPDKKKLLKILYYFSIFLFCLLIASYLINKFFEIIFSIIYIIYFFIITIICIEGLIKIKKEVKEYNKSSDKIQNSFNFFWINYIKKISKLSLIFLPLFIVDLFVGFNFKVFLIISDYGFRFFPLFFVIWSIVFIKEIFKNNELFNLNFDIIKNSFDQKNLFLKADNFNLTEREKEVLILLIKGKSYKEISSNLNISIATVKTHISNIYKKTDSKHKVELINKLIN